MRNLAYLDQHPEGVMFMYVKWWRVIATAAGGMTIAILLYNFVPGMQISLLSLVLMPLPFEQTTKDIVGTGLVLVFYGLLIAMILGGRKGTAGDNENDRIIPDGLFVAALREEMAFRSGCESWTQRQRITAPIAFGLIHILNLVFPLSAIIVICGVGAIFQGVYLKAYRRSGSYVYATFSSADFHYRYNLSILGLAGLGSIGLILHTLFTT